MDGKRIWDRFSEESGQASYWYNLKYSRVGHLFQDRYKSEAVENDLYLLTVIRYIHRNPVKAGLCDEPEDYCYSSFARYEKDPLIDSGFIFDMTGQDEFYCYQHIRNDDICLDIEEREKMRIADGDAKRIMAEKYHCGSVSDFQAADKTTQEKILRALLSAGGSLRQISRLTGATIGNIRKYC